MTQYILLDSIQGGEEGARSLCGYAREGTLLFDAFDVVYSRSIRWECAATQWGYLELRGPRSQTGHAIFVPKDTSISPPTAALEPLAKAISILPEYWNEEERQPIGGVVHVMLYEDSWFAVQDLDSIPSLLSADMMLSANSYGVNTFSFEQSFNADDHRKVALRLASNAPRIQYPKYKFLEFYRAIERLYMRIVFENLTRDYFLGPKKSLDEALNAISREAQALRVALSASGALDEAESIYDSIKSMPDNRFAAALMHRLKAKTKEESSTMTPEDFKDPRRLGVELIYAIRCAVVHAGARDLVIESFQDADDLLNRIEAPIARMALSCSGVKLIGL